jgi:protein Mpv17
MPCWKSSRFTKKNLLCNLKILLMSKWTILFVAHASCRRVMVSSFQVNTFLTNNHLTHRHKYYPIVITHRMDPLTKTFRHKSLTIIKSADDSCHGEQSELGKEITIDPTMIHHAFHETATQSTEIALKAAETSAIKNSKIEKELTSKVLNAILLITCFGFAAYSIVNVDSGMTRGWTMGEKAMRIPLDNWSSYESSLNSQPIITKTTINVIIYLLGDWLSQTVFIKKNILEFDAFRTIRNGLIGMVFGPLVHEYYEFSDWILPVNVPINRLYKILMDQTIYLFVKCSIYITAVNMLAGESWEYSSDVAKGKIKGVMFTAWKFWPFVHAVTYTAIPAQHRILWVNCVDLFWNAILALKTSSAPEEEMQEDIMANDIDDKDSLSTIGVTLNYLDSNKIEVLQDEVIDAIGLELFNRTETVLPLE